MTFDQRTQEALRISPICVGLDPDYSKLPALIEKTPEGITTFLRHIVESTGDIVSAYKPNFAFYESLGPEGWPVLRDVIRFIQARKEGHVVIADAKRGDIGNTAEHYAKAVFDQLNADAITLHPYMGGDSIGPFLTRPEKGAFILALTSNAGSADFQRQITGKELLYETVIKTAAGWNRHRNIGVVVGSTHPDEMRRAREAAGDMPFLIPGVGAQGGDLKTAVEVNRRGDMINAWINVSRSVLYASGGKDYAEKAREAVLSLRNEISSITSEG